MKNLKFAFVLSFSLIMAIMSVPIDALAQSVNQYPGYKVYVYVHGYDSVLAEGEVFAYTFESAIQRLAASDSSNLDIVFNHNGTRNSIYSVNGITNFTFSDNDGWYGYILRNGRIQTHADYLNSHLITGDKVFLYYGDVNNTKILSNLKHEAEYGSLEFIATCRNVIWDETIGTTVNALEYMGGVNIHLFTPDGMLKLLKTDTMGRASARIDKLGVYWYYAENYNQDSYPGIVRTENSYFMYGVRNDNAVTRAEAVAFIVNQFDIQQGSRENYLIDLDETMPFYDEINTAVTAGIINGYEDGTFKGHNNINLLQLVVMLVKLQPEYNPSFNSSDYADLPDWARSYAAYAYESGIINNIEPDWYGNVTSDTLMQIYLNTK